MKCILYFNLIRCKIDGKMIQVLIYRDTYCNNKISLFLKCIKVTKCFHIISFVDNTLMPIYTYVYICMI